jgi:hypothetical protein
VNRRHFLDESTTHDDTHRDAIDAATSSVRRVNVVRAKGAHFTTSDGHSICSASVNVT